MGSTFDNLGKYIEDGINGKNQSIPIGLPKLGRYANLRKKILTLIFSTTGTGKSSLLDTIMLNASDWHMNNTSEFKLKPDFQLFSMERSKELRIAKWICYIIFKNEGHVIELPKMLGWWNEKITKEELSLIKAQKEYIDCLLNDYITIHEGAKTPNEVYKIMKSHFETLGEYEDIEVPDKKTGTMRKTKVYFAKDNNNVVIPAFDHGNLTKTTQALPSKKQSIDKLVEYCQSFRDLEGASPIWIAQVNRSISSVSRIKDQEHELMLEDVKDSGDIADACDIAISIFDPIKYSQSSKTGYEPSDFIDKSNGNNYFRSAQILKSSYGADSLRVPLAFNGFCGQFYELPRRKDLNPDQYDSLIESVLNKTYFLKNQ